MGKNNAKTESVVSALIQRQLDEQDKVEGPYERALGKLSIHFSLLHATLEHFSWEVWGLDGHAPSILTKDLRTTHLIEKLISTVEKSALPLKSRSDLKALLKNAKKVADGRNELLHSLWIIRNGEPVLCFSKNRGRLVGPDAPSVADINALSSQAIDILGALHTFKENFAVRGLFGGGLGLVGKRH